jgi:tetratricopeptide (TPR) repeat protein
MGISYKTKGDPEGAIICFKQAIKLHPGYAEAYNNMGIAFSDVRKLEKAVDCFKLAVEIKPDYAEAHYNMGNALEELSKLGDAVNVYKKALFFKPDHTEAYFNMGNALHKLERFEEAIEAYNKALLLKPNQAETYCNLGMSLQGRGKLEEAVDSYNMALTIKPNFTFVLHNLANTFQEQGKLENAISTFKHVLAVEPDNSDCFVNFSRIKIQLLDFNFKTLDSDKAKNNSLYIILDQNPLFQIFQSILNFIKADFKLCKSHLQKYKNIDKTTEWNALYKENQKFCTAYFLFLSHLIKNNTFHEKSDFPKIYHIGESHCLSYAHSHISTKNGSHLIMPRVTFGAKAYHFSNNTENQFKTITRINLNQIPNRSLVFISIGEIDCRAADGIIPFSEKARKPVNKIIDDTVEGYITWFMKENVTNQHKYYFFNVPAPKYNTGLSVELNNKAAKVVKLFNECLETKLSILKVKIIDVYSHTKVVNGFSNGLYHCDDFHLDDRIIPLIQDQLHP